MIGLERALPGVTAMAECQKLLTCRDNLWTCSMSMVVRHSGDGSDAFMRSRFLLWA